MDSPVWTYHIVVPLADGSDYVLCIADTIESACAVVAALCAARSMRPGWVRVVPVRSL